MEPEVDSESTNTISVPARLKRTGMEMKLLIDGTDVGARKKPDHSMCRILARAYQYNAMVMLNGGKTIAELATDVGVGGSYFTRILRLSFLAPELMNVKSRPTVALTHFWCSRSLSSDLRQ